MKPESININKFTITINVKTPKWFQFRKVIGGFLLWLSVKFFGFKSFDWVDDHALCKSDIDKINSIVDGGILEIEISYDGSLSIIKNNTATYKSFDSITELKEWLNNHE